METNINNKTLHIPAARGRVSVPNRHGFSAVSNVALDAVAVKPSVKAVAVTGKTQTPRVTFDSMTAMPVQAAAPAKQAPMVSQAPLQTAVVVASNQPATNIMPMNVAVNNNNSVAAVPMIQVAPIQEVSLKEEKKNNKVTQSFKDNTTKAKESLKKINIKKLGSSVKNKIKQAKPTQISTVDALRYGIVAVILVITGYLAYDTWTTNQRAKDIFSQSAAAANVSGVADGANTGGEPVYSVGPDMPKYISIPKIGIKNAKIEQVGLTNNNKVDVPKDLNNAAWYDGSVKPGQKGAMFINGHINDVGSGGVFDQLKAVGAGDKITVERGDGTKYNYEIIEAVTLPTSSIDMGEVLKAHGGDQGLNLMTCAGTYNFNTMSYSHRVVVYSKLI